MKIFDLPKDEENVTNNAKILSIVNSLKEGQGIKILEVSKHLNLANTTTRTVAMRLNCYAIKYVNGKAVAFLVNSSK